MFKNFRVKKKSDLFMSADGFETSQKLLKDLIFRDLESSVNKELKNLRIALA
jgi:hypothetical protein